MSDYDANAGPCYGCGHEIDLRDTCHVCKHPGHNARPATVSTSPEGFRDRVARMHGGRDDEVLGLIGDELGRATANFGSFASAHEGYAVILEELDELWDEIKNDKRDGACSRQRKEAIQVAAMAARFLLDLPADGAA